MLESWSWKTQHTCVCVLLMFCAVVGATSFDFTVFEWFCDVACGIWNALAIAAFVLWCFESVMCIILIMTLWT